MINDQLDAIGSVEDSVPSCQHHWVIQDALGPVSIGMCRVCGDYKEFKNYLEASHWGDERSRAEARNDLLGRPSRARVMSEEDDDF